MKDEYIIINKTALEKRIEELEKEYKSEPAYQFNTYGDKLIKEIMILKQILSESTPLIPEIERHFLAGREFKYFDKSKGEQKHHTGIGMKYDTVEDYISNLKLDI